MIGSVRLRLRLAFRQPGIPAPVGASELPEVPELEFVAYAEDGRLSGRIRMDGTRLSDMLNDHDEYLLEGVLAERIPDGGTMVVPEILVRREELLLVRATGPRGNKELRTRTIPRGMVLETGPYLVTGNIHASAGIDPLLSFRRRRAMVPLTDASIEYRGVDGPIREYVDAIVVNRDLVDWVRVAEPGAVVPDRADLVSAGMRRPTVSRRMRRPTL